MKWIIGLLLAFWAFGVLGAAAQEGPADGLWKLYKEGRFEDVVREGKVELTTGTSTAQVNLAVGRSLVDLGKFQEGLVYLETAARLDSDRTWVYAWAEVYLGSAYFELARMDEAKAAWIKARDCAATTNATRSAVNSLKFLGLAGFYDSWTTFTSEHFVFTYSSRLGDFDIASYARRHEQAYDVITAWFGGGPKDPIRFFVWSGNDEAAAAGMPTLGFARPKLNLVHARQNQTVGHEMTHVISAHALEPEYVVGLISEGTAVYHDQTRRDQLVLARAALQDRPAPSLEVSLAALWEDWSLLPAEVSYPVGGAWVGILIEKGGKEKFLEFFMDQRLSRAREIYGSDLQDWLDDFDTALYAE